MVEAIWPIGDAGPEHGAAPAATLPATQTLPLDTFLGVLVDAWGLCGGPEASPEQSQTTLKPGGDGLLLEPGPSGETCRESCELMGCIEKRATERVQGTQKDHV